MGRFNPHDAVGREVLSDCEEHHVSESDVLDGAMTDEEHVAWSDRGKHAGAGDPQPYFAKASQHLGEQAWDRRRDQEAFFTVLHWPVVGLIFPQASAMVSNTCSRTNAGFS